MSSNDWMLWNAQPHRLPRVPRPSETLFSFKNDNGQHMTCELRFHGESYGWEAVFLNDGSLFIAHGGFATRAEAIRWARDEHASQCALGCWSAVSDES